MRFYKKTPAAAGAFLFAVWEKPYSVNLLFLFIKAIADE